ncbi:hypothetical protein KM043_013875 [Ampulex compressa]|nr:hypothetical protein KM043_013875 [Ampulex compressa]
MYVSTVRARRHTCVCHVYQHNLKENSTGKNVPDSKRGRAPAFSFGSRHSSKNDSLGPGPGQYNLTGLSAKGKDVTHALSLHGRVRPTKTESIPAPGDYDPQKAERVIRDNSPMYSFGTRTEVPKTACTPGPAEYRAETVNLQKSPEFSFGGRLVVDKLSDVPGPGEYSPEKAMLLLDNTLGFTFGHRSTTKRPNDIPAPNTYNIPSSLCGSKEGNKRAAPSYTMSGRQRSTCDYQTLVPGPGAYETIKQDTVRPKSPAYSMSIRYKVPDDHSQIPGPGAHYPEKVHLDIPPAHSFGIRHSPYICNLKDAVY